MSIEQEQLFTRYIREVLAQIPALSAARRAALETELAAHLDDAAVELGRDRTDPLVQQTVIERLGPGPQLGRELARVHGGSTMQTGRFWLLWVLACTLGWALAVPDADASQDRIWLLAMGGAVAALLHTLLMLRDGLRERWWRWWLLANAGPWLILAAMWWGTPWVTLEEPPSEMIFLGSQMLVGLLIGLLQWLTVSRCAVRLPTWTLVVLPLPFIAMISSFVAATVAYMTIPFVNGVWFGAIYGAAYGVVTAAGLGLVLRASARASRVQLHKTFS